MKLLKRLKLNQAGFAHVEAVLAVAVIVMVGVVGIYISKHNNSHALAPTTNGTTNTVTAANTASVSCGWTANATYTQQEPQNVQQGAPYCFTFNGNKCEFYTEWGTFDKLPFAKDQLVSGTDCATNKGSLNYVGIGAGGGNYASVAGPDSFNTWTQAIVLKAGEAAEATFQVCMYKTPGSPSANTEGCLGLIYSGT